jgi:hypothetical protein
MARNQSEKSLEAKKKKEAQRFIQDYITSTMKSHEWAMYNNWGSGRFGKK